MSTHVDCSARNSELSRALSKISGFSDSYYIPVISGKCGKPLNKKDLKRVSLKLTKLIVESELNNELDLYEAFEDSLFESINNGRSDVLDSESHFGIEGSIVSYYLLAVIIWISKKIADESVIISKIALNEWFKNNKEKIYAKYQSKKYKSAIEVLEKYLGK